jgi:hypothetical protein
MLCTAYNGINPTVIEYQIRRLNITKNKSFMMLSLSNVASNFSLGLFMQSNSVVKSSVIKERVQSKEF